MIYVFEGGSVVYDGSTLTEEQKRQAVAVESLPATVTPPGKMAILKADKKENRVYYEYQDAPVTLEDVVADIIEVLLHEGDNTKRLYEYLTKMGRDTVNEKQDA